MKDLILIRFYYVCLLLCAKTYFIRLVRRRIIDLFHQVLVYKVDMFKKFN